MENFYYESDNETKNNNTIFRYFKVEMFGN